MKGYVGNQLVLSNYIFINAPRTNAPPGIAGLKSIKYLEMLCKVLNHIIITHSDENIARFVVGKHISYFDHLLTENTHEVPY